MTFQLVGVEREVIRSEVRVASHHFPGLPCKKLLDDYKAAAQEHVPGYKGGGLSRKIAIALIQVGWRRQCQDRVAHRSKPICMPCASPLVHCCFVQDSQH
jgi:hypothetical protein